MFGSIELEKFTGLTKMPQGFASAWSAVFEQQGRTGGTFVPLLCVGTQVVNGTLYYFIAERTIPYSTPFRTLVKLAIQKQGDEYKLVTDSVKPII